MGYHNMQIEHMRTKYKVGQTIEFYTLISKWNGDRMVKVKGVIDGVYKHGMQVSFRHTNASGTIYLRRWISWLDILESKERGGIHVSVGRKETERYEARWK